jgi:MFS transporter, DHA1 family, inner membrane transport protein
VASPAVITPAEPQLRPQWPVAALATMSVAVFLSVTTELLPTGLLPAMSRDLNVTEGRLGLLVAGFALMVALFATPLGIAASRMPRRGLLVASLFGCASAVRRRRSRSPEARPPRWRWAACPYCCRP